MREHPFARLAQYVIALVSRLDEAREDARRGVSLSRLQANQRAAEAELHRRADGVLKDLSG